MIGELNTMRSCLSKDWRISKLGIHLRRMYHSKINHLTNNMNILTPIWRIGFPEINKWRCNNRRCPKIRMRYLNALIQILDSSWENLGGTWQWRQGPFLFVFIIIMSFNSNWRKSLKTLSLVSINHLRKVSSHVPRISNEIPIGRRHNKRLIRQKSITISKLGSTTWRQPPRIDNNMPTRTRLTNWLAYHLLDHSISNIIIGSSDNNSSISNNDSSRIGRSGRGNGLLSMKLLHYSVHITLEEIHLALEMSQVPLYIAFSCSIFAIILD